MSRNIERQALPITEAVKHRRTKLTNAESGRRVNLVAFAKNTISDHVYTAKLSQAISHGLAVEIVDLLHTYTPNSDYLLLTTPTKNKAEKNQPTDKVETMIVGSPQLLDLVLKNGSRPELQSNMATQTGHATTNEGPEWENTRRAIVEGFRATFLMKYQSVITSIVKNHLAEWQSAENKGQVDVVEKIVDIFAEILPKTLFDLEQVDPQYLAAATDIMHYLIFDIIIANVPAAKGLAERFSQQRSKDLVVIEKYLEVLYAKYQADQAKASNERRGMGALGHIFELHENNAVREVYFEELYKAYMAGDIETLKDLLTQKNADGTTTEVTEKDIQNIEYLFLKARNNVRDKIAKPKLSAEKQNELVNKNTSEVIKNTIHQTYAQKYRTLKAKIESIITNLNSNSKAHIIAEKRSQILIGVMAELRGLQHAGSRTAASVFSPMVA
jgi:hypothetical protein